MKLRIVAFLLLIFLSANVAAAEIPYWIDPDVNNVYFPVSINDSKIIYVEKTGGYSPTIFDYAFKVDNSNYIDLGSQSNPLNFVDEFVYEFDVYMPTSTSDVYFDFGRQSGTRSVANNGLSLAIRSGEITYRIEQGRTDGYNGGLRGSLNTGVYLNQGWNHVKVTRSTTEAKVYLNENLELTFSFSGTNLDHWGTGDDSGPRKWRIHAVSSGGDDTIGAYSTSGTIIKNLKIYNSISSDVPVAQWNIDEGSGTTISDTAGSLTGTIEGTASWTETVVSIPKSVDTIVTDMGTYYKIDITNNEPEPLTDYQVQLDATQLGITSDTESLKITETNEPYVEVELVSPENNVYTNTSELSYSLSGVGDSYNSILYIDDISVFSSNNTSNTYNASISQGSHSWYVNASSTLNSNTTYNTSDTWSFIYDSINPNAATININPDYENVANGTIVQTSIEWSDTNLKNAEFYVNYGSGYVLEDSITFTASTQWFNTSIDSTGYTGESINWYQIAYDEAGNSNTYSDSFNVVLNALNIYVYDESTSAQILPSSVVVYNENISQEAEISESTKVASLSYANLTTDKYIVRVTADGYYPRRSLIDVDIESLAELDVYLPSENETVIYDTFKVVDNTLDFDNDDIILRLDKPLSNGTDTVYSSYFDFAGTTATYLIATDQYILYVITPDQTISYGWLTPNPDGEIQITINDYEFESFNEWLNYTYTETNTSVAFDYGSSKPVSFASLIITTDDGNEVYNANASTDSGSFIHNFAEDGTYLVNVSVTADDGDIFTMQRFMEVGKTDKRDFFPSSYSMLLKSIVVMFVMVVGVIALSSYRADLSAGWVFLTYGFSVYQDWVYGNAVTVAIIGLIALAAIKRFHKREDRM